MLTLFISYVILQSSFLVLTHAANGVVGNKALPSNYQLFLEAKNWVDAELFCQEKGGHLISIHDETTNLEIANYLLTALPSNIQYSWIGFNQVDQTWTDNSPHDYTSSLDQNPQGPCTTIWAAPDSLPQNRGYWMGPPCNNAYPFMCDIPSTQCNHVNGFVTNQCISDSLGESFKYVCIDENTIENRQYSDLNCNESQLTSSFQNECTAEINCYCAATDETACNTADITVTECGPSFQQVHTVLLDKCLYGDESASHSYHCNDNGVFVWQSYDNSNCQPSDGYTEEIYPTSCQTLTGDDFAVTCGISIDRITSDCIGNEIERESVIIDECHTETFDNSPTEISKYFCDDNNELGIKFYDAAITDNCDGEPKVEYILDSSGQCKDGSIFSSTCGGFIPVEPKDIVQRITLDCAGNIQESPDVTTNYCELESFPDGPARPYEYFCNGNKQLGLKYYTRGSGNCDGDVELETILDSNDECIDGNVFDSTCHEISKCAVDQFECENDNKCIPNDWICDSIQDCSDNSDEINCPSTSPFPTVKPTNAPAVECTNNEFKCENDNKCIPNYWICDSIPDCSDNSDEINCLSTSPTYAPVPFPTVKPTNAPIMSRLCTDELQKFNIGAIFQFNGGCDEHLSALVFQDKTGGMDYSDCVKKCNGMSECKSFVFHKEQNWCNIYSVECTNNGDTDWFMFTPINNAEVMCNSNN